MAWRIFSSWRRPAAAGRAGANPILDGRGAFAGAFGDLARGKRNWQLMAFGLLGLFGIVLVAFVRMAAETRITPYVVAVDRLGRAVAVGPAEPAPRAGETDPRIVAATLALFVRNVRAVSSDAVVQRELLYRAYACAAAGARRFLDGWFAQPEHDPRLLGQRFTRSVEVEAILPVPGSAVWRAQWTEREQPALAGAVRESAWEGYLTVRVRRPATAGAMEDNPLGIYVTDLTWTEVTRSRGNGGAR